MGVLAGAVGRVLYGARSERVNATPRSSRNFAAGDTMTEINPQRLLADLRQLATFGKVGTGVDRPAFSDPDIAARRWLEGRMREAGLEARIDRYGNVFGRTPGAARAVVVGSHTD